GYKGGLYKSGTGFDMASGLGAPMVSGEVGNNWAIFQAGLTQVLCHDAAGKAVTVKVHGAGFLPIGSADKVQIRSGSKVLTTENVTCTTSVCTVKLPAESAGTVDIRIFALSLWPSKITKDDH